MRDQDTIYHGIDPATRKRFEDDTDEEFLNCCPSLKCSDCCHRQDGQCRIFEDGRLQFSRPWFASVSDGPICKKFYPNGINVWLRRYWRGIDVFVKNRRNASVTGFFLDGNEDVTYYCRWKDYYNNDLWDEDGNLKWISKIYYRQSRTSPTGYSMKIEFPDGAVYNYKGCVTREGYASDSPIKSIRNR